MDSGKPLSRTAAALAAVEAGASVAAAAATQGITTVAIYRAQATRRQRAAAGVVHCPICAALVGPGASPLLALSRPRRLALLRALVDQAGTSEAEARRLLGLDVGKAQGAK